VDRLLGELEAKQLIVRYEVDGRKLIQVNNFAKHQNVHPHEVQSTLPPVPPNVTASSGMQRTNRAFPSCTSFPSSTSLPSSTDVEGACETVDPKLAEIIGWWNRLKADDRVQHGVSATKPSQAVLNGWKRVVRSKALRELFSG